MDLISWLSKGTYKFFKVEKIIDIFDQSDFDKVAYLIMKIRHREIKVTKIQAQQLAQNGITLSWSELVKYCLVLLIAHYLNSFLSSFIIMNSFSILRGFAGGNHMSTFNKCFGVMIVSFISLGILANRIDINIIYTIIIYILNMVFAWKYAPQERPDKTDKDRDKGNKFKKITMGLVIIGFIISIILHNNHTIVSNSITLGISLEIITVTPWGIRFFNFVDQGGN